MLENVITREAAISRLRRKLLELTGNEKSVCQVATERGILCGALRTTAIKSSARRIVIWSGGILPSPDQHWSARRTNGLTKST